MNAWESVDETWDMDEIYRCRPSTVYLLDIISGYRSTIAGSSKNNSKNK